MKKLGMILFAFLLASAFVCAQDAGSSDASKPSTGSTIKKDTKTAAKDTGKGVKTAAKDTGKGAKTAGKDTEKGAKVVGKDTEKVADKTGSETKKGAKEVAKPFKKKDSSTSDTKPATSSN